MAITNLYQDSPELPNLQSINVNNDESITTDSLTPTNLYDTVSEQESLEPININTNEIVTSDSSILNSININGTIDPKHIINNLGNVNS